MGEINRKVLDNIRQWANGEDKVRRVWLYNITDQDAKPDSDLHIAIELEPVNDSEEELLLWMSKSREWQTRLQKIVPAVINLEWVDPYANRGIVQNDLNEKYTLVYDRTGDMSPQ